VEPVRLRIPDGRYVIVRLGEAEHELFGACHTVSLEDGDVLARFAAVDWAAPEFIPPMDTPGALPPGAGTAILNEIALRTPADILRYRGPYPTGALFDSLRECFSVSGDPAKAFELFTADVEKTAVSGEMREAAVDWLPSPFQRAWHGSRVCVQLRSGVEKVYVDGRSFSRDAAGARRVRRDGSAYVALVEIGGRQWAEIARFESDGALTGGPYDAPAVDDPLVGRELPVVLRRSIADAIVPSSPELLRPTLRAVFDETSMVFGDPGWAEATLSDGVILVHPAILHLGDDAATLVRALAAAIAPIVHRLGQARLLRLIQ
jgi:hypothetical protein